jgi:hypothetical protein
LPVADVFISVVGGHAEVDLAVGEQWVAEFQKTLDVVVLRKDVFVLQLKDSLLKVLYFYIKVVRVVTQVSP